MQKYRALLLGGVCLGLVSMQAGTGIFAADEAPAEAPAAATEAPAAPAATEEAAPPMTPPGVTWYSGDTTPASPPAFAAEATMNPDYAATAPAEAPAAAEAAPAEAAPATAETPAAAPAEAPAPAAAETPAAAPVEAPAAAEAPAAEAPAATVAEEAAPPMTPPGVTWYSGDTTPATPPAFTAEATMNPDYKPEAEAAAPAPAEAPAAAEPAVAAEVPKTEDPVLPMTPSGVTEFYGDTSARETLPFRAEATVYPSAPEPAPATQAAVEACRDALNAEAQAGKINFATSAWDVLPDSFKTLDKIAKVAKDCSSNFVIEVGGHTDNTGKPASNKTISELRAQSVVKYLTKAGVDAAKLKPVGYGADNPIADNGTVAGRRENRRIAFTVTGG